ncbi:MAG TPA: histidinol-phosphate transaminase, partial [Orrella sp.]
LAGWLRERAILVRHFKRPRVDQFIRITVGTSEQCASLISALRACVCP